MHSCLTLSSIFQELWKQRKTGMTAAQVNSSLFPLSHLPQEKKIRETNFKFFIIITKQYWAKGVPLLGKGECFPLDVSLTALTTPCICDLLWKLIFTHTELEMELLNGERKPVADVSGRTKVVSFLSATAGLCIDNFFQSKLGKKNSWKWIFVLSSVITSDKLYRLPHLSFPSLLQRLGLGQRQSNRSLTY